MKQFFLILILLLPHIGEAQNEIQHRKDSLRNVISNTEGKDKLVAYRRLTDIYFGESRADSLKRDTLLTLYERLFDEAGKQNNLEFQGIARVNAILSLCNRNEYDKVFKLAPFYLEYFEKKQAWNYYYNVYHSLIGSYLWTNDLETGLAEAKKMYEHAKKHDNNRGIGLALYDLSNVYGMMSRHDEEEKYMRQSIEILKKEGNNMLSYVASAYFYLCQSLISQNRFDDVLTEAKEFERINLLYEEKSHSIQSVTRSNLYRVLLSAYTGKGDWDNAEIYCRKLENMNGGIKVEIDLADGWTAIYKGRKQYAKALEMIEKEIALLGETEEVEKNVNAAKMKASILAKMGRAEDVHNTWSMIFNTNDSLRNIEFNKQLDELRTVYEVDKLNKEKNIITIEKQRNFTYFLFSTAGCALLIIMLIIWIYFNRKIAGKNRALAQQIKELTTQQEIRDNEVMNKTTFITKKNIKEDSDSAEKRKDRLCIAIRDIILKEKSYLNPNISRDLIIEFLGTNKELFIEAFRYCFGMSFPEYINMLRLKDAVTQLEQTNWSIEDISQKTGFGTVRSFERQFKLKYNMSPKDFRNSASRE